MNRWTTFGIACLTLVINGCVMKSTYDAAIQESRFLKEELERAKDEQRLLARQTKELERQNQEATRDAEATVIAVLQAKTDRENERRLTEEQQANLRQKILVLVKQQDVMRKDLVIAKENSAALQELVDVYQRKLAELPKHTAAPSPADSTLKPFDPSLLPPAQELPSPQAVTEPSKPTPAPPAKQQAEPADAGWLSVIKEWVVSLWRSVFS